MNRPSADFLVKRKMSDNQEFQIVSAKYVAESRFLVPKGFNIERAIKEDRMYIRWDKMHITNLKGQTICIKPHQDAQETIDWKRGAVASVEKAEAWDEKAIEEYESKDFSENQYIEKAEVQGACEPSDFECWDCDIEEEMEDYQNNPGFMRWVDSMTTRDLYEVLYNRMSLKDKLEMLNEKESDEESESGEESE